MTADAEPVLTVVVPVYKVEPWLDRCVSSLVGQTFRELAIILVDDGSPDRCGVLCDAWAAKDPRITVIHQANAGAGAARNAGIDRTRTPYVTFCDPDDWTEPGMYARMMAAFTSEAVDFVRCRYTLDTDTDRIPDGAWRRARYGCCVSGFGLINEFMESSACNKVFKTEILRRHMIRFPEGLAYEDTAFFLEYASVARRFVSLRDFFYHYYQHPDSHTHGANLQRGAADHLTMCGTLYDFLKREGLWERERKDFWVRCADVFDFIQENAGPRRAEMFRRANAFLDRFGADEFAWAPWWLHRRLAMIRRNGEGGEPVVRRSLLKIGCWPILTETDAPGKRKVCLFGHKLYGRSRCARYDG